MKHIKRIFIVGSITLSMLSILFTGAATAKSLYIIADINDSPTPIQTYDIQGPPAFLVFQAEVGVPDWGWGGIGLAIDTTNAKLFVTYEASNIIQLLNAINFADLGTTTAPGASNLAGIAFDQKKSRVYTIDRHTNHLYVYNWTSSTNTLTLVPGPTYDYWELANIDDAYGLAYDEVRNRLYVGDNDTTVRYFETTGFTETGQFTLSYNALGIAVDQVRNSVYAGGIWNHNFLVKYDVSAGTESTVNVGHAVLGVAVDENTGNVFVTTGWNYNAADLLVAYDSDLIFLKSVSFSGDPTGLAIPRASIGFNDTDGDGLLDTWEELGYDWDDDGIIDIDLPAMGADVNHKDIFIEVDYMVASGGAHTHQPRANALQTVIDAFNNAPVDNPDGNTGIHIHIDAGPNSIMDPVTGNTWGTLSRSTVLGHTDILGSLDSSNNYDWTDFQNLKVANFEPARLTIFHYVIFAHDLPFRDGNGIIRGVSGISRNGWNFGHGASDFIVSLGSWRNNEGTDNDQAGTLMHELGHNLGLRHGGANHDGYKPNYLSVMNYSFQTRGIIIGGTEGNFDYSQFTLPNLDENNLNETIGLNGGVAVNNYGTRWYCPALPPVNNRIQERTTNAVNNPIDWNCNNNDTDNPASADINKSNGTILTSQNDWANLVYTGGAVGYMGATFDDDLMTTIWTEEIDLIEDQQIGPKGLEGDLDGDDDVDRDDLTILMSYRNQPASNCPECDLDDDGMITVLDARKLMLMCTRARCTTQ